MVKMEIDTNNKVPIKLRPYQIPIHKRPVAESAIIERFRLP